MSANRDREEEIFDAARELAADARAAYLAERCGQDADLRQRIEGMLTADAAAGEFFKTHDAPSPTVILADASPSPSIEKAGDRIGRYKLLQQIGEGGMGLVYMAEQEQPVRRSVALKIIKLGMDTRQVVARFEAERQALAMMNHPHIAKVFDAGATDSGRPYFVMELVRGIPITEYCDKNCLPTRQRLDLFILVCQAVQHAHQKGVIHRDLKPSNILVTLNDGVPWPMIIDFGIAKATHQRLTEKTLFTQFTQMIGTPAYMSPEQAEMSKLDVDTRTDIYALGVLLYELLTGTTPFSTQELLSLGYREMQRTIAEREPLRLSTRLSTMANEERTVVAKNRSVDAIALGKLFRGDLDWIAMKCLEKDRARRYETANALAADIRRHLDCEPVVARPPSRWYEFQKTLRRHKFGFAAAGSVIMALAIGLGVSTTQFIQKNRAYHRATAAEREQSRLRQQAEATQKKSETEAAKATAISDFLQQMLRSANPEALKGSEYTVRQLLDDFSTGLTDQLKDQPEVEAAVRATIGRAYFRLGVTDKALPHQERALMLRRGIFAEQAEHVAESLVDCAWTCFEQMQYAKGEAYAREALEIYRQRGATGQPVIYALWAWQRMLIAQSRFAEVEAVLEEAFALARKSTAAEFPDLASMIHGLADVRNIQSRHAEAETLALKAVTMHRRLHGAQHPETGWALVTLGVALRGQQKLADAEAPLQEALKIFRKYHTSRHNSVDAAVNELKLVFEARGDFAAMEALYRNILAGQRAKLGNDSPDVAETLNSLGIVFQRAGKRIEAEQLFREAEAAFRADLALRRQRFGDVHREVDAALWTLAQALEKAGKLADAEAVYREELALERKLSGDEHPFVANSLSLLGSVLLDQGKLAEAEVMSREALAVRRKHSADETLLARSLAELVMSLLAQGKFAEAEAPSRECVAIRERKAPDDWRTFNSRSLLGGSLLGQKKYAEAAPLLLAGYEGMKQREKAISLVGRVRIREALQRLSELHEAVGQPDKAAEWNKKLAEFDQALTEKQDATSKVQQSQP